MQKMFSRTKHGGNASLHRQNCSLSVCSFLLDFFFRTLVSSLQKIVDVSFIFMDYCSEKNLGEKNSFVLWSDGADML